MPPQHGRGRRFLTARTVVGSAVAAPLLKAVENLERPASYPQVWCWAAGFGTAPVLGAILAHATGHAVDIYWVVLLAAVFALAYGALQSYLFRQRRDHSAANTRAQPPPLANSKSDSNTA